MVRAIVLAGGESRRMGQNKALLSLYGKPMITHVVEEIERFTSSIVISTNEPNLFSFLSYLKVEDHYKGLGPLAALESAMAQSEEEWFLVAACDMPFINHKIYNEVFQNRGLYKAVVPVYDGRIQPMSALYHKDLYPLIVQLLEANNLRMVDLLNLTSTNYFSSFSNNINKDEMEKHFINLNYPDQYKKWQTK
ncbi:NTP transferase domain-containing protein [Pontibacillus yanchengensis]|uniref:NTP transferase domain-containing protein n=2 Tax=Pontibacillus yanchengensis TaxID=462910 RepID=A0ACC7VA92_9BACI|nr:molybdenum cofactor guanylyltransferase [Pontibacillus yanchengensis]MYL32819.1 NTP transferase domain-containing protein [Pontibacillus yanchengensis]MYL51731.1 NTP transferase domain-containing protein [Pontibacillus yanchengensis]